MNFFVHVIDDASHHVKKDNEFVLVDGIDHNDDPCQVKRSDAFYIVDAVEPLGAVTKISNRIMLSENTSLAKEIKKTAKKLKTTDFSQNKWHSIEDFKEKTSINSCCQYFKAVCHLPGEEESIVVLHNIHFFVVPADKIIEV